MPIPTEPVGSLPRPMNLQQAFADYDAGKIKHAELEREQDAACLDSIKRSEATGEPIVSDGEQRMSSFATYPLTDTLAGTGLADHLAADGQYFAIFTDGHHRQLPRLTGGPFKYKTFASQYVEKAMKMATKPLKQAVIAPSMLALLYPLDSEVKGYTREQFLSDLVDQCEKDIRGAFKAGAKRVSIDFTEGRLACRNDPRNPWTGRNMLAHFIELNNRVLDRFNPEERKNIGIHTCPGGDCDATHSADVDYAELLPSMFKMNAGYFLMQMSSEKDKEHVYKLCGQHSRADANGVAQVCFIGVINPQNPRVEFARGSARRVDGGLEAHSERTPGLHRRLRLLAVQHRRQAKAWLSRRGARHRVREDHIAGQRDGDGVPEAGPGLRQRARRGRGTGDRSPAAALPPALRPDALTPLALLPRAFFLQPLHRLGEAAERIGVDRLVASERSGLDHQFRAFAHFGDQRALFRRVLDPEVSALGKHLERRLVDQCDRAVAADVFDLASDFVGFSPGLASVFDSAVSPPETSKPMMKDTSLRTPSDGRSEMNA